MNWIGRLFRSAILHLIVPGFFLTAGWYLGAKNGAWPWFEESIDSGLGAARAALVPILGEAAERGKELADDAASDGGRRFSEAAAEASDYVVGTLKETIENRSAETGVTDNASAAAGPADPAEDVAPAPSEGSEAAPLVSTEPASQASEPRSSALPAAAMNGEIIVCLARISNPPRGGDPGEAIGKSYETASVNGVTLMLKPATKSCLSSGFGYRNGRLHKGVDYFTDMGGQALAGGDGVIVEAVTRSDYGNMLVIDHGNGVYTRYAHLARFSAAAKEGASVKRGDVLGPIGMSGASSIVHLHYEVLTGDFDTPAKSFGLEPMDPFGL
ncbi:MAG: peptidoglycan DD-metalloendopeptidase family protein [Pseudomonadota bacterium]